MVFIVKTDAYNYKTEGFSVFTLRLLRYNHKYRSDPSVFIFIYSVCEVTSVFEAATKKTDSGTEAKTEGL